MLVVWLFLCYDKVCSVPSCSFVLRAPPPALTPKIQDSKKEQNLCEISRKV